MIKMKIKLNKHVRIFVTSQLTLSEQAIVGIGITIYLYARLRFEYVVLRDYT